MLNRCLGVSALALAFAIRSQATECGETEWWWQSFAAELAHGRSRREASQLVAR